jgi:hypothetical protein
MNILARVISSTFDSIQRRIVKIRVYGLSDTQARFETAPYGTDSNPIAGMVAVFAPTTDKGRPVIVGYINKNQLAGVGEHRTYATDTNGELKFYIWQKADGTCEIGGSDDNMVRYSKLADVINELQNDIGTLKNNFSGWTPVPNDGGAALKTATASWAGTALTKDIADAKIDEIKTL